MFHVIMWTNKRLLFNFTLFYIFQPGQRLSHVTVSVTSKGPLEMPAGGLPEGDEYKICGEQMPVVGASVTFNCNPRSVGR